jgi:hypothetical protein
MEISRPSLRDSNNRLSCVVLGKSVEVREFVEYYCGQIVHVQVEEKFPRNFSATEKCTAYHVLFGKMSLQDTILERSYRTQSLEYRLAFIELISIEKALKFDLRLDFGFKIIVFHPPHPTLLIYNDMCVLGSCFLTFLFCM